MDSPAGHRSLDLQIPLSCSTDRLRSAMLPTSQHPCQMIGLNDALALTSSPRLDPSQCITTLQ